MKCLLINAASDHRIHRLKSVGTVILQVMTAEKISLGYTSFLIKHKNERVERGVSVSKVFQCNFFKYLYITGFTT